MDVVAIDPRKLLGEIMGVNFNPNRREFLQGTAGMAAQSMLPPGVPQAAGALTPEQIGFSIIDAMKEFRRNGAWIASLRARPTGTRAAKEEWNGMLGLLPEELAALIDAGDSPSSLPSMIFNVLHHTGTPYDMNAPAKAVAKAWGIDARALENYLYNEDAAPSPEIINLAKRIGLMLPEIRAKAAKELPLAQQYWKDEAETLARYAKINEAFRKGEPPDNINLDLDEDYLTQLSELPTPEEQAARSPAPDVVQFPKQPGILPGGENAEAVAQLGLEEQRPRLVVQNEGEPPMEDPTELVMRMMQMQEAQHTPPEGALSGANLQDPMAIDWNRLRSTLQLSDDEIRQLQTPAPEGGPTLQERLQALRPGVDLGQLNLELTGRGVQGRMQF